MDAFDVEMSIAEGEQALQALLQFAREYAGKIEAHEAEKGLFKGLLPIGLAAMKLYFAQRGTGDVGLAITREDGMILPREPKLGFFAQPPKKVYSRVQTVAPLW